ncbi:DUF4399 domain-containing protein [Rhizosphaericola mali]|uniref:DUF4399 domain-containing protein n=1 Tax=Rhizosphaericola mali TaxID=2545455 RepID=A0A5P2G1K1_9BACT|nr:DUF4399 domain-containing protein [Rhizosphaericola mali]QES87712.1 DUF4399 domain-containing protein [Rhizosphaericola mali]
MIKKLILPAVLGTALFAACNSGSSDKGSADSTSKDTMTMEMPDTAGVPPLPAIPAGAKVFFKAPKDGATVTSPVKLEFGQENIALAPKGEVKDSSGHHHVIVDGEGIPAGTVIPDDSTHFHYGKAQTEASINLKPGKHTLILQYGDGIHRSYGPALSDTLNITVK